MDFTWKDTIVLITGASKGIGANITRLLLEEEDVKHVAILDVDEKNGTELQNELNAKHGSGKVKFTKCDVSNEEHLMKCYDEVLGNKSYAYVVINNAAIVNEKSYRKEIDINMTAVVTGTLKALDLMRKDKGGKGGAIINISSIAALQPEPCIPIYNATKSAVMQFSVGVGSDEYYLNTGVRVLTICFGRTDTGIVEDLRCFDEEMENNLRKSLLPGYKWQSVTSAARGVIDMYKKGKSASIWLSDSNKPVRDITHVHKQAYELLTATVYT